MGPFYLKDCALIPIATGLNAQTLIEFRDILSVINASSIYFHFWGGRLQAMPDIWDFHNDFSLWAHLALHEDKLAERLDILNPGEFTSLEELRYEIIDVIEDFLDSQEFIPFARREQKFHFIDSSLVVFDTHLQAENESELLNLLPGLTKSSLFFHFIDARRRNGNIDDFSHWLSSLPKKNEPVIKAIQEIDPFFISLDDLQKKLILAFTYE